MKNFVRFCKFFISATLVSLILSSAVFAAEPSCVPLARKVYSETNNLISSGNIRVSDITFPWNSAPHAVVRTTRMKYYYTEKTGLDKNDFPTTTLQLRKVVVTHQFGKEKPMETDEYYFHNGALLFYYLVADVTEENLNDHLEYRYYFDGGKLKRAIEETRPINGKSGKPTKTQLDGNFTPETQDCAAAALKKAARLTQLFKTLDEVKGFN